MAIIFVVEDNENLRDAITSFLRLEDYVVFEFDKTKNVYDSIGIHNPDLIILDVMLPDGDGFLLAKKIRKEYSTAIIFLTARESESDRVTGFEVGGDDYVVKPFSPRELVLRVKSILKRTSGSSFKDKIIEKWQFEEETLTINRDSHLMDINKKEITLTASEWKILDHLMQSAGIVVDRQQLLSNGLDYNYEMSERTIITHIKNLRSKLGHGWIETVRGFGYRFRGESA